MRLTMTMRDDLMNQIMRTANRFEENVLYHPPGNLGTYMDRTKFPPTRVIQSAISRFCEDTTLPEVVDAYNVLKAYDKRTYGSNTLAAHGQPRVDNILVSGGSFTPELMRSATDSIKGLTPEMWSDFFTALANKPLEEGQEQPALTLGINNLPSYWALPTPFLSEGKKSKMVVPEKYFSDKTFIPEMITWAAMEHAAKAKQHLLRCSIDSVLNACRTVGQLKLLWPDIESLLTPEAQATIRNAKAASTWRIPSVFHPLSPHVCGAVTELVLTKPQDLYKAQVFLKKYITPLALECRTLPDIDDDTVYPVAGLLIHPSLVFTSTHGANASYGQLLNSICSHWMEHVLDDAKPAPQPAQAARPVARRRAPEPVDVANISITLEDLL